MDQVEVDRIDCRRRLTNFELTNQLSSRKFVGYGFGNNGGSGS